jgi:hypothetical protein
MESTMTTMNLQSTMNNSAAHPATVATPSERTRRVVYVVTERMTQEGTRSFWTKVGAAFENRDGSVTVRLDALPLTGTLQIRDDERDAARRERAQTAPF